jgi:hypothetical protein
MKKYFPIATLALAVISCSQPKTNKESRSQQKDTAAKTTMRSAGVVKPKTARSDSAGNQYPAWVDTLVTSYINTADNDLVRYAVAHHLQESWVLDDRKETDSATYWVFNVGHDVSDAGGKDTRYTSDSWIYVDSAKRKLYEYDGKNEKLVEWRGKGN